jgi:hypothetical protein
MMGVLFITLNNPSPTHADAGAGAAALALADRGTRAGRVVPPRAPPPLPY